MSRTPRLLAASIAVLVAGCNTLPPQADYVTDADQIVKAADWKTMETLVIEMAEHSYHPGDFKLKAGQPYKLVLKNVGEKEHYLTAPEFFRSIATRKAMVSSPRNIAEVKAPYFTALEVYKGQQLDFFFVPVRKGAYKYYCTIDDHRDKGMEGTITVD